MPSADDVIQELSDALDELRSFDDPTATATRILDRDSQVFSLIGLVDDGMNAVYYDWPIWTVRITPIDDAGVGGLTARDAVSLHHYGRVETYIEDCGAAEWDWLHPRYRWLFADHSSGGSEPKAKSRL